MNELIAVKYESGSPLVSARDLHEFLGIGTLYKDWFPRMCEYGFAEGVDFNLLKIERVQKEGNRTVSRRIDDAALTIEMAKEICMLQRNEKGKQARQYFLRIEKNWNSPEKVMARALKIANDTIDRLEAENAVHMRTIEENKPKVLFADSVSASKTSILIGEMAKILKQNGVEKMGQNRLFAWMRENGYLIHRKGTDYNMPTQHSMELGLFEIKETTVVHKDGYTSISKTPKLTGRGQLYFTNKFLGEQEKVES